jgi:glycosyltransferase involved in cell wall biosynthesis
MGSSPPGIVVSTIGKFHNFDLARELHSHNALKAIFTGYPRFKLRHEALPSELMHTYPWVHTPYMALGRGRGLLGYRLLQQWEYADRILLDHHVSKHMPECDVFVGLSGSALQSGKVAHARGAKYVCDRGSTHIRIQDQLLREEHERWGIPYAAIDPRIVDREESEYAEADCITIPSTFALRSFVMAGVAPDKLRRLPYGVNLSRFEPSGSPDPDRFDILFVGGMSLRKGVPYLIQAYGQLQHRNKSLTFAGLPDDGLIASMKARSLWPDDARVIGHVPQNQLKELMSRSHVLVLPSIEEGLALVLAQAMSCGCPAIGTEHTGAADLFEDGKEGFIVPIRSVDAIVEKLQRLAEQPELRARMSEAAVSRVRLLGGWRDYGRQALSTYAALTA